MLDDSLHFVAPGAPPRSCTVSRVEQKIFFLTFLTSFEAFSIPLRFVKFSKEAYGVQYLNSSTLWMFQSPGVYLLIDMVFTEANKLKLTSWVDFLIFYTPINHEAVAKFCVSSKSSIFFKVGGTKSQI